MSQKSVIQKCESEGRGQDAQPCGGDWVRRPKGGPVDEDVSEAAVMFMFPLNLTSNIWLFRTKIPLILRGDPIPEMRSSVCCVADVEKPRSQTAGHP